MANVQYGRIWSTAPLKGGKRLLAEAASLACPCPSFTDPSECYYVFEIPTVGGARISGIKYQNPLKNNAVETYLFNEGSGIAATQAAQGQIIQEIRDFANMWMQSPVVTVSAQTASALTITVRGTLRIEELLLDDNTSITVQRNCNTDQSYIALRYLAIRQGVVPNRGAKTFTFNHADEGNDANFKVDNVTYSVATISGTGASLASNVLTVGSTPASWSGIVTAACLVPGGNTAILATYVRYTYVDGGAGDLYFSAAVQAGINPNDFLNIEAAYTVVANPAAPTSADAYSALADSLAVPTPTTTVQTTPAFNLQYTSAGIKVAVVKAVNSGIQGSISGANASRCAIVYDVVKAM